MHSKKFFILLCITLVAFTMQLPAQKSKPAPGGKEPALKIAPQVAAIMDADVQQRKTRSDIPLTYQQTLYLPGPQNQGYPIFLFQIKNADLNFAAPPETPDILKANNFVFVRVYRVENGVAGEIAKEHFIRFDLEEKQSGFQPNALNYYSIAGDIYPPGTYLLALALCTPDFAKISTCYAEFNLPDVAQIKNNLLTTPIYSVNSIQQIPAAETKLLIHKNCFVLNTLLLGLRMNNEFKASESLDLFYFIIGAKPDSATNALSVQITYKFKKNGTEINKLAPQTVTSPVISQPIAFSFTEITKNDKGVETQREDKLLEPGDYILEIELLDNVSKAKGVQEFKFKIVQ